MTMSEIQNHKKRNKKKKMVISKALLGGTAMILAIFDLVGAIIPSGVIPRSAAFAADQSETNTQSNGSVFGDDTGIQRAAVVGFDLEFE